MNIPLAVYIGAGLDLKIIKNIPEIKNFVFIDSQPNSEFGLEEYWYRDPSYIFSCICPNGGQLINNYTRPQFINNLKKTAKKEDIKLVSEIVNKKLIFNYNDQIINYFVNISIPEHLNIIKDDIRNFNHLIVSGFFPDYSILQYTNKSITFWGNRNIIYNESQSLNCLRENDKTDIVFKLNNESLFEKKFKKFNLIQDNRDIICFSFWENFIKFIINTKPK